MRLLQLSSPALPVGAFSYSQAMEWAMDCGALSNEEEILAWICDCLEFGSTRFEAVYLAAMMKIWKLGDFDRLKALDSEFKASRESSELLAETLQMGHSMMRLLADIGEIPNAALFPSPSFPLAWSAAAAAWDIDEKEAISGYLWSWAENQVMAAVKAMPLGQTAGQRMLLKLGAKLSILAGEILKIPVGEASNFLPAFSIASCLHETQYARLFKS
ncbi:MAG: urease accessory protein UreF [Acidocella sp. 20-61-6]|nr:MAG: urease accessory protein UreF [Acidocella sp. 20-61-6]HQT27376.1 urease accessory UreF family protein [Burkholderiales bacterium]